MIEVSSTIAVNQFHQLLGKVEHGQSVRIRKHGRAVARMVPDCDFMSGADFSKLFAGHKADEVDKATADEISNNLEKVKSRTREKDLAH